MANWSFDNSPAGWDADQAERVAVFNKIAPAGNWKLPIDAVIAEADLAECREAAIWFTGGSLKIVETLDGGMVRVEGPGYYAICGA